MWSSSKGSKKDVHQQVCVEDQWMHRTRLSRYLQVFNQCFKTDQSLLSMCKDPEKSDQIILALAKRSGHPEGQTTLKQLWRNGDSTGNNRHMITFALLLMANFEATDGYFTLIERAIDFAFRCQSAKKQAYTFTIRQAAQCFENSNSNPCTSGSQMHTPDFAFVCGGSCRTALDRPGLCSDERCNYVSRPLERVKVVKSKHENDLYGKAVVPPHLQLPILNPSEDQRIYSSTYNYDYNGTGHARSTLGSAQGWSARNNNHKQWMIIDAKTVIDSVVGILVSNRGDGWHDQIVTHVAIDYAMARTGPWKKVKRTRTEKDFKTRLTSSDFSGYVVVPFPRPVKARFIRIRPLQWENHISLRCGLLVGGKAEARFRKNAGNEYRDIVNDKQLPVHMTHMIPNFSEVSTAAMVEQELDPGLPLRPKKLWPQPPSPVDFDVSQETDELVIQVYKKAKEKIWDMILDYFDTHKENAFNASMHEPARFYYHLCGNEFHRDHVNVHGLNGFLCIVRGWFGCNLPIIPLPDDSEIYYGCSDVWMGLSDDAWDIFSDPKHFGKASFESMMGTKHNQLKRTMLVDRKNGSHSTRHRYDPFIGRNGYEMEEAAKRKEKKFLPYANKFGYFFTKDFLVKKMFENLNAEEKAEFVGFRKACEELYPLFKKSFSLNDEDGETLLDFFYDEYMLELDVEKATLFFYWLGVVKKSFVAILTEKKRKKGRVN